MKNRKSKNILLVGLGNLGSNYIRAIKSLSYKINLYIHDKNFKALNKNYDYPKNINLIKIRNIKNFKKKNYLIPKYDKATLIEEANLFCDWYIKKNLPKFKRDKFIKKFKGRYSSWENCF